MDWRMVAVAAAVMVFIYWFASSEMSHEAIDMQGANVITLPKPSTDGKVSVEEALYRRRSRRVYADRPLTLPELSQLLWSAQGVSSDWGGRTAPSAGATYPLEAYAVVGKVDGVASGVYHYIPETHTLRRTASGDLRKALSEAALGQEIILKAPVILIIAADYNRTTLKYGDRGVMYVHMEAGHAGQNIYLQADALGLGTVAVGAFDPSRVKEVLGLPADEEPLYLFPVGKT